MYFSLILATLNRPKEIKECLYSLINQECQDFEVLVIDQSENDLTKEVIDEVIDEFEWCVIKYYKVEFKGLSKARNFGIKHASGLYLCLLDDDAIYSKNYLCNAKKKLTSNADEVLSGKILSIEDRITPFVKYEKNKSNITVSGIINYCPSAALIIPLKAINQSGAFNEQLGVGNKFAAGEETDLLLRIHDLGYKVLFCDDLVVYHPIKPVDYTNLTPIYSHAMGKGALARIDFFYRKKMRMIVFILRNTIGMFIKSVVYCFNDNLRRYYKARMIGFWYGFRNFEKKGEIL